MKKYSCEYPNGDILRIKDWKLKIEAESPRAAYDEFLSRVGIYEDRVIVSSGIFTHAEFDDHIETARQRINEKVKAERDQREKIKIEEEEKEFKKETEKYSTMTKDEFLLKMIQLQNKQIDLFENQIKNQNEQTGALNKIRWAIIALLIFIVGQTIVLKMKLGL